MKILRLLCTIFGLSILLTPWLSIGMGLPQQPTDQSHPGSDYYQYQVERIDLKIANRKVALFLPKGELKTSVPMIVFGHGQALNVKHYLKTFEHLAGKGIAVMHPMYDKGFFDLNWSRMANDFNSLTAAVAHQFPQIIDKNAIIYSGHSKGAYVALMAAGAKESPVRPASIVLFAPADWNADFLVRLDSQTPLTVIWGQKDKIISKSTGLDIFENAPSTFKQFIEVKSYPESKADHFFPLTRSTLFGGNNGASAYHYYGVWKWLIGAALDLQQKTAITNEFIYGDSASTSGNQEFSHRILRNWR